MKIDLDKFQILYYLEGCAHGSHLRQGCWHQMIDLYPQFTQKERDFLYTYAKRDIIGAAIYLTVLGIIGAALSSCRTQHETTVRTEYVLHTDTICSTDSTIVLLVDSVYIKGDTVERWHTCIRERTAQSIALRARVDTIYKNIAVTTEADLTGSQRFRLAAFPFLIGLLIALAAAGIIIAKRKKS